MSVFIWIHYHDISGTALRFEVSIDELIGKFKALWIHLFYYNVQILLPAVIQQ